jgi:hypothetical protein
LRLALHISYISASTLLTMKRYGDISAGRD